jgi:AcrR family transcriptional regulator
VIDLAGVSRGGFFYHFPTKEALVVEVVTSELDRFEAVVAGHVATGASYPVALTQALVGFVSTSATMMASVTAALAFGEPVRGIVVARHRAWNRRLRAEMGRDDAHVLGLALDGLIFGCSLDVAPPSAGDLRRMRAALLRLAGSGAGAPPGTR